MFQQQSQTGSQHSPPEDRTSEEWQDWMDWSKTSNTEDTPRTSLESAHQLPSPQNSSTSDEPPLLSKKRKVSEESVEPSSSARAAKPLNDKAGTQNKSHSIVEKRYRTNLNQKIAELGDCIPNLKSDDSAQREIKRPVSLLKHNKATVLTEAITYIKHLEQRNRYLEQANLALQQDIHSDEAQDTSVSLESRASEHHPTDSESPPSGPPMSPTNLPEEHNGEATKSAVQSSQGIIKVPEEWRRMWRGELKAFSPGPSPAVGTDQDGSSTTSKMRRGKYMGRLMVGSLAGMMVMDGFAATQEGSKNERGLFALPILRHMPQDGFHFRTASTSVPFDNSRWSSQMGLLFSFLKVFLIFCMLGLLLFIYLFTSRPPSRWKRSSSPTPQPAPSVASPLEVRQRAFLTAIQTIWFPRHHALPEMLALNVETAAYVIRQLLGWHMYSWLTGRSEDEEIARVRAWDIAIDAQLLGGDPEISKSRLVLSLWASGTLPSTPARCMLKALHIRVLFWQPSRWVWLTNQLHRISCKLAEWQMDKARRLQSRIDEGHETNTASDIEPLTDHLRALLAESSEKIFTDDATQKASNLAWNISMLGRSSSDSVYEDTAMRGPLDALASWCSCECLTNALKSVIEPDGTLDGSDMLEQIALADDLAPPGSLAKIQIQAAKAVLMESDRIPHVEMLVQQLAPMLLSRQASTEASISVALSSVLEELKQCDYLDVSVCAHAALMLHQMNPKGANPSPQDPKDFICQQKCTSLGLLGWIAFHHLIRGSQGKVSDNDFMELVNYTVDGLERSKHLDSVTIAAISASLKRLPQPGLITVKKGMRRCSEVSTDTGYASMSDNDIEDR